MFPEPIQRLINHFQKFPGVGPRQAAKFAFRLVKMTAAELASLAQDITNLKNNVGTCQNCFLSFDRSKVRGAKSNLCRFCSDSVRDHSKICVVETERDALSIEKAKTFNGVYHVLGGTISLLDKAQNADLNLKPLYLRLKVPKSRSETEVIMAMNATIEGQATALYLEKLLQPLGVKITRLAQGLSTGSEIEYVDETTLANAFKNRR